MSKHLPLLLVVAFIHYSCHSLEGRFVKNYSTNHIKNIHQECNTDLEFEIFERAMIGLNELPNFRNRNIITIIDYSKPSHVKRLYVIDLKNKKVLYNSLVSHGINSGKTEVDSISNVIESRKSSVGFMMASETYLGDHGLSLRLDGLETGINDNVRKREIVIHSADYATQKFLDENGYLGRSYGCPAIAPDISESIINLIAFGSCVYIHTNHPDYLKESKIKIDLH